MPKQGSPHHHRTAQNYPLEALRIEAGVPSIATQAAVAYGNAHRLPTNHPCRTLFEEPCCNRLKRPSWRSTTKALTSKYPDTLSSRDALQTLLECPWATQGQWQVLPRGKLAPTDPPPTAETCLQATRLLDGQLTIFTDSSASAGTKDGGAEVIVTQGDPAGPAIPHQRHLRGAAFTSSFAEKAAAMPLALEWATTNHPECSLTIKAGTYYGYCSGTQTVSQQNSMS